jgi:type I restriction enzyme S subunit
MKAGWMSTCLEEVATIQSGVGFPEKYQGNSDHLIPYYKVSDMNTLGNEREMIYSKNSIYEDVRLQIGAKIFPKGSIIFPKIGGSIATNKKRLTSMNSCVDNNVMGAIPKKDKIKSDFLFYFFESFNLSDFANDAYLPSIKSSVISNWSINLPRSLTEQDRIVKLLDEAFGFIGSAQEAAEKNLQNARSIFESQLQAVFLRRGDDWEDKTLEEISLTFGRGKSRHRPRNEPKLYGGNYPFIQTGDIRSAGHFITEFSQTYSDAGLAQSKLWPKGTICITIAANIAETGILGFDACFPDSVIGVVPHPDKAEAGFIEYLLQYFKTSLQSMSLGSARDNINMTTFEHQRFPFPTLPEQRMIVLKLDELSLETEHLKSLYRQKLTALVELKKSLLYRAFNGDL